MSVPRSNGHDGRVLLQAERPKKLAENVAARLLNYITAQGLAPGTSLASQKSLLENLDVGRASLREALRFLEMHGFIELRAGRNGGPIVGDLSTKNFARMSGMYFHALGVTVREVMDARLVLEPAMVRALAERGVDTKVSERLTRFGSARRDRTEATADWSHSMQDFHWSIAELSGNGVLRLVAESTREIYSGVAREVALTSHQHGEIEDSHASIADAILAGDSAKADTLMSHHLQQVVATYEKDYPHLLSARIAWP